MQPIKPRTVAKSPGDRALTLGAFAYAIVAEQYRQVVKQEKKVIADKNPEHLHQMRVGTRRLRTALQVFERAIVMPKAATAKRIGALARVLGRLRDLDVQTADLQQHYHPDVSATEQRSLDDLLVALQQERRVAFAAVEDALARSRYQQLKIAYEDWLHQPRYTTLAKQPLLPLVADLLSPLLSTLLLHPGWLVQADASDTDSETLHDLRKVCKQVRYQAEFFVPFYSEAFQTWLDDVKTLQAKLGTMHDSQVLRELLATYLPKHTKLPGLQALMAQTQMEAMSDWDTIRQRYLKPEFRRHLHRLLLEPLEDTASDSQPLYA